MAKNKYMAFMPPGAWKPYESVAKVNSVIHTNQRYLAMPIYIQEPKGVYLYQYINGINDGDLVRIGRVMIKLTKPKHK